MSYADDAVERMSNPDVSRHVRRHLERTVAKAEPAAKSKPKKTPPPPLPREAAAVADAMGWDHDQTPRIGGGTLALGVIADLREAGWALVPVPKDYGA